MISKTCRRAVAIAASAFALLLLPTCRSMDHTVARVVTRTPGPAEVFVPQQAAPPAVPTSTPPPAMPPPTVTPTVVGMPVVTAPPASERSPGVLYEQMVPTVVAVTPRPAEGGPPTRTASPRSTRVARTATPAVTQRPGVYYEDAEGRPLPTPTP